MVAWASTPCALAFPVPTVPEPLPGPAAGGAPAGGVWEVDPTAVFAPDTAVARPVFVTVELWLSSRFAGVGVPDAAPAVPLAGEGARAVAEGGVTEAGTTEAGTTEADTARDGTASDAGGVAPPGAGPAAAVGGGSEAAALGPVGG